MKTSEITIIDNLIILFNMILLFFAEPGVVIVSLSWGIIIFYGLCIGLLPRGMMNTVRMFSYYPTLALIVWHGWNLIKVVVVE